MAKMPKELTAENLTDCFIRLAAERYPNPAKIKSYLKELGIAKAPLYVQIIVIQQFRDAVRQVGDRLVDSKKREKLLDEAIIPFLEDLEDRLDAYEEGLLEEVEEENEEKKKKKGKRKKKVAASKET